MPTTLSNNVVALLPEYILTIVGVLIMLGEPLLPAGRTRKPLGWLAILGAIAATGSTQSPKIGRSAPTTFAPFTTIIFWKSVAGIS